MFTLVFLSILFFSSDKLFVFTSLFFLNWSNFSSLQYLCLFCEAIFTCCWKTFIDNFYLIKLEIYIAMCKCLTWRESIHFLGFYASIASFKPNWLIDTFFMFWGALLWFSWENWWKSVKRKNNLLLKHIKSIKS